MMKRSRPLLLPAGSFDTHVHVFNPLLGPYASGRAYTPEDAPLSKLLAFNQALSTEQQPTRLVLVQPSPYKTDCTVLMKCLQELKRREITAYGIVVVDLERVTDDKLDEMHRLGARGIRLNFQADGKEVDTTRLISVLRQAAERIHHLPGCLIQLFVPGWTWDVLHDTIQSLPVVVIADHLGGMLGTSKLGTGSDGDALSQPGFKSLVSLARQSRVVVKVSGLYRVSDDSGSNYSDLRPIIQMLASEVPDQIIWGSDWPHTGEGSNRARRNLDVKEPFREIDDRGILQSLMDWLGDEMMRQMLKDNPERLYE
ncbi:uncharacterized protein KD926_005970 [Aspergillus affinis]|uniref:uncharacterized protein n=1 Tax=Aspergillus affinis TaxID=1070780 RepID=UPI0022FF0F80|nr:uncharacterized protein KD926_005970 [Aspergillus affinis]KAI9046023.1 hypothetical protein KD926_005970 [Aspergillus affinis]